MTIPASLKVTNVMLLEKLQVIQSCTWQRELQFVMPVEKACTTIFLSSQKKNALDMNKNIHIALS